MAEVGDTRICSDFDETYHLATDSQEVISTLKNVGVRDMEFGSLFILEKKHSILEVWGSWHNVPYNYVRYELLYVE